MMPSPKIEWKHSALRLFLHVNATLTTKDIFKSKLGKRSKLNTKEAKNKTEKRGKKKPIPRGQ
jgi:hypothetical protein